MAIHSETGFKRAAAILAGAGLLAAATVSAQEPLYGTYYTHDPSTLIKDGTNYYFFSSHGAVNINRSSDLRNWSSLPGIFTNGWPAWITNAVPAFESPWAPDVAYFNGQYHVYYSCSEWATIDSAIGLVTSPSLNSPVWTDHGKVIQSDAVGHTQPETDLTSFNCIDPNILVATNGTVWMAFGSYSDGILVMQLDPLTGKRISPSSPITKIANNGPSFFSNTTEASCLWQRGGYYYLFLNFGGCCAGVNSTYNIRVGRSTSITGPYLDRNGASMLNGGGTMLLESTGRFIGPGHAGILSENGTNWFTYHYYDGNENGNSKLGLARLEWTADGWPALTNDWSALYTFNVDAREHRAQYNGTLLGGAAVASDDDLAKVLELAGSGQYVRLPNSAANARTFAAWIKWDGGADWQRVFDFGNNSPRYLFLTPRTSTTGRMRFAITTNDLAGERVIDAPLALPTNSWCHVAVTLDGSRGVMYLNGDPVATNASLPIRPWQVLARSNYIGKSQIASDPTFNGRVDSFRLFSRALSAAEVKEIAWAHPSLAHRYSFTSNAWDSIGMAHGRLLGNATVTNEALQLTGAAGGYVNLPGGLVYGCSAVSVEFWASFGANGSWARVFDFGNYSGTVGQNYLFFSPNTATAGQRLELVGNSVRTLDIPGSLNNRAVHVVCVVDPAASFGAVYTNGVLEASLTATWPALNSVSTAWSFLGRSLWSGDAWLNGTIDEFRIYDGRLTPEEIAANHAAGPNTLPQDVEIAMTPSAGGLVFEWPSHAPGFVLESAASPEGGGGGWSPASVAPIIENGLQRVTVMPTEPRAFFRLRR
jgi:beta-xylosidase